MEEKNTFIMIPTKISRDDSVPMGAKVLFGEIAYICNMKNNKCYASNNFFSEMLNASDKTITRWLNCLEEKGYIKRKIESERNGYFKKREIEIVNSKMKKDKNEKEKSCNGYKINTECTDQESKNSMITKKKMMQLMGAEN